jgi:hypothetical protein
MEQLLSVYGAAPVVAFQSRTIMSGVVDATILTPGETSRVLRPYAWPSNVHRAMPVVVFQSCTVLCSDVDVTVLPLGERL